MGGELSPRQEVIHALINAHNPPGYPSGPMLEAGYPYSCPASSFCGGEDKRSSLSWHKRPHSTDTNAPVAIVNVSVQQQQ
jgi:hypothetical protein